MEIDDALYKAFLVELEALEKFRMAYTGLYPLAPLGREDQDVRRLIEAMAIFTARTRLSGQRALSRTTLRLFRQHFSYVLNPLPAMTMLKARLDGKFVDAAEIPRGSEVIVSRQAAPNVEAERLHFRTLAPIRLLPVSLESGSMFKRAAGGWRLLLRFESAFPRNDEIGTLRLYVNYLNELLSSLTVHHALKTSLLGASVFFDQEVKEDAVGRPCEVRFGAPPIAGGEVEAFDHPLQLARAALHFPQQELFLDLEVPAPPRNWRSFTVVLDLSAKWPSQLRLTAEAFELNVAPMINLMRTWANPVECDGLRERYAVQHPDPLGGFRVQAVMGVYRLDGEGMIPLRPGVVEGGEGTYETEHEGQGVQRKSWVSLSLGSAFQKPIRCAIDAYWHQPRPQPIDPTDLEVALADRYLEGAHWSCLGPVVPAAENRLEGSQDGLLQLLSIKNQRFLRREELHFVLEAMGARDQRLFTELVEAIASVEVRSKPFARATGGFKYIYRITWSTLDPFQVPALSLLSARMLDILAAWSTEEVVELEVAVPNLELNLAFTQRTHG